MEEPNNEYNGWPQYKLSVLQQLEHLIKEQGEVKDLVHRIDKEVAMFSLLATQMTDLRKSIIFIETEMKTFALIKKMDEQFIAMRLRLDALQEWKTAYSNEQKGKASRSNIISIVAIIVSFAIASVSLIGHFLS